MRSGIFLSVVGMMLDILFSQLFHSHGILFALIVCLSLLWSPASLPVRLVSMFCVLCVAPVYGYSVLSELLFLLGAAGVIALTSRMVHGTFLVRFVGITMMLLLSLWGQGAFWTVGSLCGTLMVLVGCLKYTAQDA